MKKVWNDGEYASRPTSVDVTLTKNGTATTTTKILEAPTWTAAETGLPKYDAEGHAITYSWTEAVPNGYELTSTTVDTDGATVLTNTLLTSATVKKVWNDGNNVNRPGSLTVTLNNGKTTTEYALTATEGWTKTVSDLPKYDTNKQAITYTWSEPTVPAGYSKSEPVVNADGSTTITNTLLTSATVKKVWDDDSNRDEKRPASLSVTLSNGQTMTLTSANNWTATVENLPKYANGEEIQYSWTEGDMPEGYSLTKTEAAGTTTTLTNSYNPATKEIGVQKVWNDANDRFELRPSELKVTLSNGTEVTLSESNGWKYTLEVPVNVNGSEIQYTWTEGDMPEGYSLTDSSVNGTITTLSNTLATYPVTYQYTGKVPANAPAVPAEDSYPAGWNVTVAENPTLRGYEFSGWSTDDASVANGGFTMPAGPVVLEGSWSTKALHISSATRSWMYDGTYHTEQVYTVTYDGVTVITTDPNGKIFNLPTGDTLTIIPTGDGSNGVKNVDLTNTPINNTFKYTLTNGENYKVTTDYGTLSITPRPVSLTSESGSKPYDGTPLTKPVVTVGGEGFVAGEVSNIRATGSVTNVNEGTVTNTIAYDTNAGFNPDNYLITKDEGELYITPVTIKIIPDDKTKVYDNDPSTDPELTATEEGVPENGDKPEYELTREPGQDVDEYTITVTPGDNPNYIIEVEEGKFTITPRPVVVTIVGNTDTKVYNGSEQQATGYVVTDISDPLYNESYFSFSGDAVASGTNVRTYPMGLAGDQYTNNNANFTVTFNVTDGWLTITPKPVVVTAEPKEKKYGEPNPPLTATVEGTVNGETISYTLSTTATQTSPVGEYPITPSGAAAQGNYTVTYVQAPLTITPLPVTVKADDQEKKQGDPDPELTVTITGLEGGGSITYTVTRDEGETPGSYPITPAGEATQGNYIVTYIPGTLVITPATPVNDVEYTVTYVYIGKVPEGAPAVPETKSYKVGDPVPAAEVPSLEGYEFKGWNGEPGTMPAENVTVTGQWVPLTHTVTIIFKDITTGQEILVPVTLEKLPNGTEWSYQIPEIEGYFKLTTEEFVTGIISGKDIVITIFYAPVGPEPSGESSEGYDEPEGDSYQGQTYVTYQLVDIEDLETPLGLGGLNLNVGECIE